MIERASDRCGAVRGGKITPLPTDGGKLLPLDHDSSFKRIAYVITNHTHCRHPHPAGTEYAPSWPWRPWPQKSLAIGSHYQFQHHGSPNCGWKRAKPSWQLVQFAAASHRRHALVSGYEPGRIGHQGGVWFRSGRIGSSRIGSGRSLQDKRYGLTPTSRIAASSCSAVNGLLKNSMDWWPENLPCRVALS